MRRLLIVAMVVLLAAACGDGEAAPDATSSTTTTTVPHSEPGSLSDPPAGVVGQEWRAVLIIDGNDDVLPPVDARVTVRFEAGAVSGSAGCNTFSGAAVFAASQIDISDLAITEMACTEVDDWLPMIEVLSDAVRVELVGPNLIVWSSDDRGLFLE